MFKKLLALVTAGAFLLPSTSLAYEVKPGDTLTEIANFQEVSLVKLIQLNPQIVNPDLIFVGEVIKTNVKESNVAISTIKNETQQVKPVPVKKRDSISVTASEKDLLARLVRAEALGESFAGKVAVANVVLNRVDSTQFPNSIQGVINQRGQFSPVSSGSINKPADAESLKAVVYAINNRKNDGSLYFYNPRIATSRWLDTKETVAVIGNHVFKR